MPLYIRDDAVDALADLFMKATGARTKTEAVRAALQAQLNLVQGQQSLGERLGVWQILADELGPVDPAFDMKKASDEIWDAS